LVAGRRRQTTGDFVSEEAKSVGEEGEEARKGGG
jgi:hypothetical protein